VKSVIRSGIKKGAEAREWMTGRVWLIFRGSVGWVGLCWLSVSGKGQVRVPRMFIVLFPDVGWGLEDAGLGFLGARGGRYKGSWRVS
jgi:hypothetical protein